MLNRDILYLLYYTIITNAEKSNGGAFRELVPPACALDVALPGGTPVPGLVDRDEM